MKKSAYRSVAWLLALPALAAAKALPAAGFLFDAGRGAPEG
jgi:hypothetical protein